MVSITSSFMGFAKNNLLKNEFKCVYPLWPVYVIFFFTHSSQIHSVWKHCFYTVPTATTHIDSAFHILHCYFFTWCIDCLKQTGNTRWVMFTGGAYYHTLLCNQSNGILIFFCLDTTNVLLCRRYVKSQWNVKTLLLNKV